MGKAIFYCVQCSKRVTDADLESGKGARVGDGVFCGACVPAGAKTTTSKKMPAVPRPTPAGTPTSQKINLPPPPVSTEAAPPARRKALTLAIGAAAAVAIAIALFLAIPRKKRVELADKTILANNSGSPDPKPTSPNLPDPRESAAGADLAKAREFGKAHPEDLTGRLREFTELVWRWDGTQAGREAAKEAAAVKALILERVGVWMAELEEKIKDLVQAKQYVAAANRIEELKSGHSLPEWKLAAEKRASELFGMAKKHAEEEDARKSANEKPAPSDAKPVAKALSEEGKRAFARWEAAAVKATARDFAGAVADLEASLPSLQEGDVKAEAQADAALLRNAAAVVQQSIGALRQRPRGGGLSVGVRDAAGVVQRVGGTILQIDADRVEIRSGKDSFFVDWSEVSSVTLVELAQTGAFEPRTLAALCLLEGDVEAAKPFRADLPAKWWTYAEGARARLPKPDPVERSARDLYASAEKGYRSMETRAAAIDAYRALRADYGATALVKAYAEKLLRRSEAGKEYYFAPGDFRIDGTFRMTKGGKLESAKDSDERETLLNFAELEFASLPGQAYRCWIQVGACCEETFLFYIQGSELTDTDPKTKKKIAVEPGSGFAVPVKHSIRNLKKTHAEHKPKGAAQHPKTAARWEWVEVTLPKYAAPGAKKLRFMTSQAGFSIAGAIVTATRKGPPLEAEIKDLEKVRVLDEPPMQIDPDLVGWWTFEEGSGTSTADQTGRGHGGKLVGDAKWVEGKVGGALEFGGGTSGVEIADAEDLRIPGDLTMAIWVRKAVDVPDWVCIMGRGLRDQRNYGLWLESGSRKYMFQQYAPAGGTQISFYGTRLVEVGKWTHLAVTVEQDLVKLYHNGELDGQTKRSGTPWAAAAPLGLGYAMQHLAFSGALDDARLYRRALSPGEVRALYDLGR